MTTDFAPWLLSSRVSPPRLSINASRRQLLLDRLTISADKRIILVEAPAGFGKTLLLSQWRELRRLEEDIVAWLSVSQNDQADNLLSYLAFAFHQAGLDTADSGLLAASHNQGDTTYYLGKLLALVEQCGRPCVIVLDDFENMGSDAISEVMDNLLRLQPANMQIVISCRLNPGLPLSSLAVEGNVLHIGAQELMFSREEVDRFFQHKLGNRELENILTRTGGWPVALQLIRSFGEGPSATANTPFDASGSRLLGDYFREQLLDNLDEREQDFLLETAMLESITIDCADFIRERDDSGEIIHGLDYLEGIFSQLDDELEAWRVHPLVREHLLGELRDRSQESGLALCRRAATWMAAQKRGLEAMHFALAAGDPDYAAAILEEMGGVMLWIREGMSRLTAGLELLQDYPLDNFPRLQLGRCLLHTKQGDIRRARQAFEKARRTSSDFTADHPGGDDTLLKIERYSIEIMLAEYGCSPSHPILPEEAFRFMLENTRDEPAIHGYIKTLQCLTSLQMGEFEACIKHGQQAICEYLTGHSLYGELFIYFYFGMAELARARTTQALKHYNQALQMSRSEFPGDTGLRLLGHAVLGEYYWETGDTVNTRKHIRPVIADTGQMESYFDIYMSGYHTAIYYLLYDKGIDESLAFIDSALQHAQEQSLARLHDFLVCKRLSVLYLAGNTDAALAVLEHNPHIFKHDALTLTNLTWRELEALGVALARAGRLRGDTGAWRPVIREITGLAGETRNARLLINMHIQAALDRIHDGKEDAARQKLLAATGLAGEGRYLRPFLNELPFLGDLVADTLTVGSPIPDTDRATLQDLANLQQQQKAIPGTSEEFSAREIQILTELSLGQPDKLIARQTGLSAHGVRYHLKNIYAKMGVENRVQAISRAREMELI